MDFFILIGKFITTIVLLTFRSWLLIILGYLAPSLLGFFVALINTEIKSAHIDEVNSTLDCVFVFSKTPTKECTHAYNEHIIDTY